MKVEKKKNFNFGYERAFCLAACKISSNETNSTFAWKINELLTCRVLLLWKFVSIIFHFVIYTRNDVNYYSCVMWNYTKNCSRHFLLLCFILLSNVFYAHQKNTFNNIGEKMKISNRHTSTLCKCWLWSHENLFMRFFSRYTFLYVYIYEIYYSTI